MPLVVYKPTSPARRRTSVVKGDVDKVKPERSLLKRLTKQAGRNAQGKITVRHRGGGARRHYRMVDFRGDKFDISAKVASVEYDPNRSARIVLLVYVDGEKRYALAPTGLKKGDTVISSKKRVDIKVGNRLPLAFIPSGVAISNIELQPGGGGKLARSAGAAALVMALEGNTVSVKIASGEIRSVHKDCLATIGQMSNIENRGVRFGKAGRMRHKGKRPTVRGKAMNPVDHPHGGGEGNQPIGLKHPKTPWGKPALGVRTRKANKYSDSVVVRSRRKKKRG